MYMIYVKTKSMKRFYALDLTTGSAVCNLIFASIFREKEHAEQALTELESKNLDCKFEIRKKG